jgi:predicted aminopeptidase
MVLLRKKRRQNFFHAFIFLAPVILSGCSIGYFNHLFQNQLQIIHESRPVEEVLKSDSTSAEEKRKLRLILEAKQFGEEKLGLKNTKNYTVYADIKRKYVAYIVSAASKYELKPYQWRFPIAGTLLYKGFFDLGMAVKEKKKLEEKGLDTYLRPVAAYSTLGWFKDPVLSSMLKYDDEELVNITIHELAHATLYRKDFPEFNEGFATFIGNQGSLEFFRHRFGRDSKEYKKAEDSIHDNYLFSDFLKEVHEQLKEFYALDISREDKIKGREKIFSDSKKQLLQRAEQFRTDDFIRFYNGATLNNAFILSLSEYFIDMNDFYTAFKLHESNLRETIDFFKGEAFQEGDPRDTLKEWIKKQKGIK